MHNLEESLLLFFTGYTRSASKVLGEQDFKSKQRDSDMIANLNLVKELSWECKEALESGDLTQYAQLMNVHWEYKKSRSAIVSNDSIDRAYQLALENGALGGKLIGAGGGGFLLFFPEDRVSLRRAMRGAGLQEVHFRFDFEGTRVIVQS